MDCRASVPNFLDAPTRIPLLAAARRAGFFRGRTNAPPFGDKKGVGDRFLLQHYAVLSEESRIFSITVPEEFAN
jgi:hypothetical protein